MLEIQKVEEMKQELEKSKNGKENLLRENDELEEKLKSIDNESKESQIEYEIRKNEYDDSLSKAKKEINFLRKSKNAIIDNNNIFPLDTIIASQVTIPLKTDKPKDVKNILTNQVKNVNIKQQIDDSSNVSFIEKNSKNVPSNVSDKELSDFLKKNNINSMNDLEEKVDKYKNEVQTNSDKSDDDTALKSQILSLINSIKS